MLAWDRGDATAGAFVSLSNPRNARRLTWQRAFCGAFVSLSVLLPADIDVDPALAVLFFRLKGVNRYSGFAIAFMIVPPTASSAPRAIQVTPANWLAGIYLVFLASFAPNFASFIPEL